MKHIFWMAWNNSIWHSEHSESSYKAHLADIGIRHTFARDAQTPLMLIKYDGFTSVQMQAERVS